MEFPSPSLLLLALCLACGRNDAPRWQPLLDAGTFAPCPPDLAAREFRLAGHAVRILEEDGSTWLESPVERADWHPRPRLRCWQAALPLRGMGRPPAAVAAARLLGPDAEYELFAPASLQFAEQPGPGSFYVQGGSVYLRLGPDEEPPERLRFRCFLERHVPGPDRRHVRGRRFSGEGIALLPGERLELSLDLPPRSALSLTTCAEAFLVTEDGEGPVPPATLFSITLDGEPLLRHEEPVRVEGSATRHRLLLPRAGRRGARLVLEVRGDPAFAALLSPSIGPAEVGRRGARPWPDARPDIVVFQADTFRADNLATYGGDPDTAPFLDELARESLVFRDAHSVSTYTLPAHATLFTGLFPQQAGIAGPGDRMSSDVLTLARLLGDAGYRTGAVTDATFVSQAFGLERDFELFDERYDSLQATIERAFAFLDADDGRPSFLFVQSYRVHSPYELSAATAERLRRERGLTEPFHELERRARELSEAPTDEELAEGRVLVEKLRARYLGAVGDFDRELRELHGGLGARGLLEHGYFVFLSDHGEAFLEHGELFHRGRVWEELTRVPLFLSGPGVEPGVVERPVSLVDFAPTLAVMAGLAPPPSWVGTSLFARAPPGERPILLFQCKRPSESSTLAVISGGRKVIALESAQALGAGAVYAAFDLTRDPGEEHDLAAAGEEWPAAELARHRPLLEAILRQGATGRSTRLSADEARALHAMGYGGE